MNAKVSLVGAGPGDPGLITVKGLECIRNADVVVYDYLSSVHLLEHAPAHAELIYVGKRGGDHTLSQDEINALIVAKAREGLKVTRLKGGDPFIFGRGGEEAEILVAAGVPYEIVPGVTSAIAAPAYAGIPLTHRDYTSALTFVTGHEDPLKDASRIDWDCLARSQATLVFFMGVKNLPQITQQLMAHGMPADKPVALVRWGTTPRQVTVTGTLENIVERVTRAGLKPPAIIVVGEVVDLGRNLRWFEGRPLMGKRVIVTRAREQASELVDRLYALGAECLQFPTIEIVPPDDWAPLDAALDRLETYDWLVFTSVNSVDAFFARLFERGRDARALSGVRTATVGTATAARLRTWGLNSDILPDDFRAEAVAAAFAGHDLHGRRVLLPRAKVARPILPEALARMGAVVDDITVYNNRPVTANVAQLLDILEKKQVDLITFTSSSTARNFKALIPPEKFETLMNGPVLASIGPVTTETATQLGFNVHITAQTYTIPGLCEAILAYYHAPRES